jgi:hypothetical protein
LEEHCASDGTFTGSSTERRPERVVDGRMDAGKAPEMVMLAQGSLLFMDIDYS